MAAFLGGIMKQKIIITTLILLILAGLCGCGKKSEDSNSQAMASKDYIYKMEDLGFDQESQYVNQLLRAGEAVYAYGFNWSEETQNTVLSFYQIKEDGTLGETYKIPVDENAGMSNISMDKNGDIYCIINRYQAAEQTESETGEALDGEVEYIDEYYLTKMNLQGEEIYSVKLNDIPEFQKLEEENGYFYVGNMIVDQEKGIYISIFEQLAKFDMEGNFVKMTGSEQNELDGASVIQLQDGRMAALVYEEGGLMIALADLDAGTVGEKYKLPGVSYEFSCYAGIGYDLYLADANGVYGYNIGDADKTQLLNYVDSDFGFYNLYSLVAINEREFFALYDSSDSSNIPAKFTKVDPGDVKDKKQITFAMVYTDWDVRREVVKFNKSNEEYRINIINYNSLYGSEDDYNAGLNKLNTDIISGKVPDIILLENSMPVDSYINKGVLEDLKPYIEKDEELDINNFMPNVIEAFSVDGKLFTLVPSYYISTLMAKTSDVGSEMGWTVQEAMDVLASKPEGTQFINNVTREYMLNNCMTMAGSQFVDWETGVCSFNSDGFIQMLEFINSFPEEVDDAMFTDDYWNNYDSMWREGRVLAAEAQLGDFRNYNYMEKGTFGEKITMIGFPSEEGKGSVIFPTLRIAMSAKSANKEGAWQFLRTFLTDEYQENNVNYSFPISVKRLEELAAQATQKSYYTDENGNKVEYDDTYYVGGIEVVIPPMTEQETKELMEQIYSITEAYKYDESLLNIIKEEAAPYFAGQKSAKEVASIIQSRVQIYVNENR